MYEGLTFPDFKITISGAIYIESINEARMTVSLIKSLQIIDSDGLRCTAVREEVERSYNIKWRSRTFLLKN